MMDAETGKRMAPEAHLAQSIGDILRTYPGRRCMKRDYGSRLLDLVDLPGNPENLARITEATIGAIRRWLPTFRIRSARAGVPAPGQISVEVSGEFRGRGVTIGAVV